VGAVHSVGIGSIWDCRDRQRQLTDPGLEDALWSQEWHSLALEYEPLGQQWAGQDVAMQFDPLPQPFEGCESNPEIPRGVHSRRIRPNIRSRSVPSDNCKNEERGQ
jgi:hypothetical protein